MGKHWTLLVNIYRSDLHISYSYELVTCTGADPEFFFKRGRETKKGDGVIVFFLNIAILFML